MEAHLRLRDCLGDANNEINIGHIIYRVYSVMLDPMALLGILKLEKLVANFNISLYTFM